MTISYSPRAIEAALRGWGWAAAGVYFGGKFVLEATGNDFWNEQ